MDHKEDYSETRGCILVLCGLPGSGKTSLCQEICRHFENRYGLSENEYFVVPISYDNILTAEREQILVEKKRSQEGTLKDINTKREDSSEWKSYRNGILHCVDKLFDILTNLKCLEKPEQVPEEVWMRFSSSVAMEQMQKVAMETKPKHVVMVIDDNMYYSSMRYQYYQVARNYHLGFCQVYLSCSKKESTRRNAQRVESVTPQVIADMAEKFEVPDPSKNKWERNSLILTSTQGREVYIDEVLKLIGRATHDPVEAVEEVNKAEQEDSRVKCSQSVLHQADLILRQIVAVKMAVAKGDLPKEELKHHAKLINTVKANLYASLKEGHLTIPERFLECVANASKDRQSPLFVYIEEQFHSQHEHVRLGEGTSHHQ